ncbi:hypothetical protein TRVA0_053S00914 [Trichomonascus vanleenenianus]|uniref:GATA-like domain-containing protein n=1 Tax=Trichomonascus vanleenenianus TaxID=2268995 RepID=UPI003ECAB77A
MSGEVGPSAPLVEKPKRNTNLAEISNAVFVDDDESFRKSTYGLKRTRSMGVLDEFQSRPSQDLIGSMGDYPHLQQASYPANPNTIPHPVSLVPRPTGLENQPSLPESQPSVPETQPSLPEYQPSDQTKVEEDYLNTSEATANRTDGYMSSGSSGSSLPGTPELPLLHDDSAVKHEPSRHVDYLSHNWKESDISASWRYIVLRRNSVANSARLENASWRTWTKAKYNLKTVSPESVNWLKDYDVTWLYGPLYEEPAQSYAMTGMTPLSPTLYDPEEHKKSTIASPAVPNTKPILKKKSISQMMLDRPVLPVLGHHSYPALPRSPTSEEHHQHHHPPPPQEEEDEDEEMDINTETAMYMRHHNYRHRPRAGPTDENLSMRINQQYRHVPGHLYQQYLQQPQSPDADTLAMNITETLSESSASATSLTPVPSVGTPGASALPVKQERHIHFNDRVEQCRAVEQYIDDSDGSGSILSSDRDSDDDEDEEDEDEAGLFLMVRSTSSVSLHRTKELQALDSQGHRIQPSIELLPATTLKYDYDDYEREARQNAEANSVAYAMSHNTTNRRQAYKTYDYNSVYESPSVSPQRRDSEESFSPITTAALASSIVQTTTENATGQIDTPHKSSQSSSAVAFLQTSSAPSPPDEECSSEFVEDTSASPEPEQQASPSSTDSSEEDKKIGRLNSAVNVAKDFAQMILHGNWKQ